MKCDVAVLRTLSEVREFAPAWREFLTTRPHGATVFNDPAHLDLLLSGSAEGTPCVIVVSLDGRPRCIAAFHVKQTTFTLKLSVLSVVTIPVRMLSLLGASFVYASGDDPTPWFDEVFAAISREESSFDLIRIYGLNTASDFGAYCLRPKGRHGRYQCRVASPKVERVHQVRLGASHEAYLGGLGAKTRQNLRRTTRRLMETSRARVSRVDQPEHVEEFLAQLDDVYRKSWQAKTLGYRPRNTADQLQFFRGMAHQGWLRAYVMLSEDRAIAFELGYQYDGVYWGQECGYDQDWASYGPGSVLMFLVVEDLFRTRPPMLLDFGFGDAPYKESLSNAGYDALEIYLVPPGRWRWILRAQSILNAVFVAVRRALVRSGLDRMVRRRLKHRA